MPLQTTTVHSKPFATNFCVFIFLGFEWFILNRAVDMGQRNSKPRINADEHGSKNAFHIQSSREFHFEHNGLISATLSKN